MEKEWNDILKNVGSNDIIALVRKKQRYQDCKVWKLIQAGRTFFTHDFFLHVKKSELRC